MLFSVIKVYKIDLRCLDVQDETCLVKKCIRKFRGFNLAYFEKSTQSCNCFLKKDFHLLQIITILRYKLV